MLCRPEAVLRIAAPKRQCRHEDLLERPAVPCELFGISTALVIGWHAAAARAHGHRSSTTRAEQRRAVGARRHLKPAAYRNDAAGMPAALPQ